MTQVSSPFRKSFSTLGSPNLSWEETLNFAQQHNFDGVELRCLDGNVLAPSSLPSLLPAAESFSSELTKRGLQFQMLGTSVKLLNRTPDELADLRELARYADATGCPWLRIFDGGSANEPLTDQVLAETSTFLNEWEKLRETERIRCQVAVETHDAFASMSQTAHAIEQLPSFHILWDTHHTWRFGEKLSDYYDVVRDRTVHYHLKDSVDRPSKRKPFTYVCPGTGEFPWAELKEILQSAPPQGFLSFEWEKHWNPELAPIDEVAGDFHRMTENW